jgi:hypothetical protein
MEISKRIKGRKPIFDKKENENETSTMYSTTPNFYRPESVQKPEVSVNYQSRIIYSPKHEQTYRCNSMARTVQPINIRVSAPAPSVRVQQQVPQPQPHPVMLNRPTEPILRTSYSYSNVAQPIPMVRPQIVNEPVIYRREVSLSNENQ